MEKSDNMVKEEETIAVNYDDDDAISAPKHKPDLEDIEKFSREVVEYAESNEFSYLSSLAIYCQENDVAFDDAVNWISDALKSKIQAECMEENILPKESRLPF